LKSNDKVAIVTGAGRGIGEAISIRLAKEGVDIVVCDIDFNNAQKTAEEIKAIGRQSLAIRTDVSKSSDVEKMVNLAMEKFGRIDILVNNAGIVIVKPIIELEEEEWDKVIDVDLKGIFLCSKAVAKVMINQKSGKIINISSDSGKTGYALFAHYNAAKFGVIGFTQGLAKELAPYKINVNAVCPGIVGTKMWDYVDEQLGRRWGLPKGEALKMHIKQIPLGRLETPQDVAGIVAFLASPDADYMTGQAMNVTGGREMH
jgi:meso-butanediol dehydrogenase/(S,S)-butanediol dehydrogenase/diacetyl reductase